MPGMIEYLDWRGDLEFETVPFNRVDNLIFSQFAYMPFEKVLSKTEMLAGVYMGELATRLYNAHFDTYSISSRKHDVAMLAELLGSKRFWSVPLTDFVSEFNVEREEQFAAFTAH
ncbi:MAG: hypothetical protein IJC39_02170 [Firmicutes bacterium]|nr:hypothetical protein [Bacillota bacterium]